MLEIFFSPCFFIQNPHFFIGVFSVKEVVPPASWLIQGARARYELNKTVKPAKHKYRGKLEQQFCSNDCSSIWKGLQIITNYKPEASNVADLLLPNQLANFDSRLEMQRTTPPQSSLSLSATHRL